MGDQLLFLRACSVFLYKFCWDDLLNLRVVFLLFERVAAFSPSDWQFCIFFCSGRLSLVPTLLLLSFPATAAA